MFRTKTRGVRIHCFLTSDGLQWKPTKSYECSPKGISNDLVCCNSIVLHMIGVRFPEPKANSVAMPLLCLCLTFVKCQAAATWQSKRQGRSLMRFRMQRQVPMQTPSKLSSISSRQIHSTQQMPMQMPRQWQKQSQRQMTMPRPSQRKMQEPRPMQMPRKMQLANKQGW